MYDYNRIFCFCAGTGMYVSSSLGTGTGRSTGPQPNNSYAIVDTGTSNIRSSTRLNIYCCSNTSTSGRITFPNGYTTSGNNWHLRVKQYRSYDQYYRCIRFHYYYYGYSSFILSSGYSGIYTCSFSSSQRASIGLYNQGTTSKYYHISQYSQYINILCLQ